MSHYIPTSMNPRLRKQLVDNYLPAKFIRPVTCSIPLVEPTLIETPAKNGKPARLAVSLVNFSSGPVKEMIVTIPGVTGVSAVRSLQQGELAHTIKNNTLTVTLPLAVADMLLIDRK
jgi:hypothetical protein